MNETYISIPEKSPIFRNQNNKAKLKYKLAIKEISKVVKANHYSYEQIKYIFKQVRKNCNLKSEKKNKGAKEHLSQEEAERLINMAYTLKGDLGIMVKTLLFTGVRVNEFVNIQMKDIYMEERKIFLSTTKGDKPRYIPIFEMYWSELKLYIDKENRSNGYLFESNRHDAYSTRRVQQIIKGLVAEVGIQKKITPHRLRTTIAVWLKEKGVPEEQIQQFLGHSKLETTHIYTQGAVMNLQKMGSKLLIE